MNSIIEKVQSLGITHKEVLFNFYMPIAKISHNSVTYKNFVKNGNKRVIYTDYGKMETRNRILTEHHHKIIMAIISEGTTTGTSDGKLITYFREIDILKRMGMGIKNHAALKESIKHIADAQFYITVGTFSKKVSIFQEHMIQDSKKVRAQAVVFNEEYVKMCRSDFSANGKNIFSKIRTIPYSTIPSIIYCLIFKNKTSEDITYLLEDILIEIGFPIESPKSLKTIKQNLKLYEAELRINYNIIYNPSKKTLTYKKIEEIQFVDEVTEEGSELLKYNGQILKYNNKDYRINNIISCSTEKNQWTIVTNSISIKLNYFLDDLLFYLERTCSVNENNISLEGLFKE